MNCAEVIDALALTEGPLDTRTRAAVDSHVAGCELCVGLEEALEAAKQAGPEDDSPPESKAKTLALLHGVMERQRERVMTCVEVLDACTQDGPPDPATKAVISRHVADCRVCQALDRAMWEYGAHGTTAPPLRGVRWRVLLAALLLALLAGTLAWLGVSRTTRLPPRESARPDWLMTGPR